MPPPLKNKPFWMVPFTAHATRGIIRDQAMRRRAIFALLVVTMLLLFAGVTLLETTLRAHPVWFLLFWLGVGWLTLAVMLLALFDLLAVRALARKAKRNLRGDISPPEDEP